MIKTVVQCSLCTRQADTLKSPGVPPKAPRGWYTIDTFSGTQHLCSAKCLLEYAQSMYRESMR